MEKVVVEKHTSDGTNIYLMFYEIGQSWGIKFHLCDFSRSSMV